MQVRTLWGELDKSNGSQFLAEFLQYHHSLEKGLVVQPEGRAQSHGWKAVGVPPV